MRNRTILVLSAALMLTVAGCAASTTNAGVNGAIPLENDQAYIVLCALASS